MEIMPVGLQRTPSGLQIEWSNGQTGEYSSQQLRDGCPCATCREKHGPQEPPQSTPMSLPVLSLAEAQPLRIESMQPVGNYAYNIAFSDGHDSGIYTFEYLLELANR